MRAGVLLAVGLLGACLSAPPDALDDLVETVEVPTDCTIVTSETVLPSGVGYQLVVRGLVTVGADLRADADYFWNEDLPGELRDVSGDVDLGVAIDDLAVDAERLPDWGPYRDDHRYQVEIVGKDAAIRAQFHDTACGNNAGVLVLEILGPPG